MDLLWGMVIAEISLLIGGVMGFLYAISLYDAKRKPMDKIKKKTPAIPKEKPKKEHNPTTEHPKEEHGDVDLFSKIPNKDVTWTGINCELDGTDDKAEILKNRSKEDGAYSILKRKKDSQEHHKQ